MEFFTLADPLTAGGNMKTLLNITESSVFTLNKLGGGGHRKKILHALNPSECRLENKKPEHRLFNAKCFIEP